MRSINVSVIFGLLYKDGRPVSSETELLQNNESYFSESLEIYKQCAYNNLKISFSRVVRKEDIA